MKVSKPRKSKKKPIEKVESDSEEVAKLTKELFAMFNDVQPVEEIPKGELIICEKCGFKTHNKQSYGHHFISNKHKFAEFIE
jgi:formylmethanofuran dehydrogenase subunit E